jgi:phosphatidylserine/phosphatidylglycerophosphate/cardiolipin synthase-like enzyme
MIDVEFENPSQVDRLADFAVQKIQGAKDNILYVAFLFTNCKIWKALKNKALEGLSVSVFSPPITSYSGGGIPDVYKIYQEASKLASERNNFHFFSCPLWWQKDRDLSYLRSLTNVAYTLHAKFLVVDDSVYLPTSNFESAKHYDICLYSTDPVLSAECITFSKDLEEFSVDMAQTQYSTLVEMIREATKMTVCSQVKTQKSYPFKRMLFVAPFYKYEPDNFVRQQIVNLIQQSNERVDVMFQHFMPDVKPWSIPNSPSIMEALVSKYSQGVDVRILAASGVTNQAAIRAEDAPVLKQLLEGGRIKRSPKVHAKFMVTDRGFLGGSMNINPSSLFQSFFAQKRKVDIDACLHILLPDAIASEHEVQEERYGTIWQSVGYKSSVEVLLVQNWNDQNKHLRESLRDFFDQSWSSVKT